MLRTDHTTPPQDASIQPSERQPERGRVVDTAPSRQQPVQALSGLLNLSRTRSRSPEDATVAQPSAKKFRLTADLPARTERKDDHALEQPVAHGDSSITGAEGAHAVSHATRADAAPLGGKVVDIPGLPMLSHLPSSEEAAHIETAINHQLKATHGPIDVFGYHVTSEDNVESLRKEGFSADKNQGKAGGVAGMNIDGPGLYTTNHPTDSYVMPDRNNVMFAVVVPKRAGLQEAHNVNRIAWDSANHQSHVGNGDFIKSDEGEQKINPGAISKVGLVPIARIGPTMSQAQLAMRAEMGYGKPAPAKDVSAGLHEWVSGAIANHPDVPGIASEKNGDAKLDKIAGLADNLLRAQNKPADASKRLLMMDLKRRFPIPD